MKIKIIHSKNLSTECWLVQAWGMKYCDRCEFKKTKNCGGKEIRKTGKNILGKKVPIS